MSDDDSDSASGPVRNPRMLVCMSVSAEPQPGLPADQVHRAHCKSCRTEVWVSATMMFHVVIGAVTPACQSCAQVVLLHPDSYATIHPDQVAEFRSLGILEMAENVMAAFNRQAGRTSTAPEETSP